MAITKISNGLYQPASGIWQTGCGNGWKFEAYSSGELIASEYARDEEQRQQKSSDLRRAFSGLPYYEGD